MLKTLDTVATLDDPLKQFVSTWTMSLTGKLAGDAFSGLKGTEQLELRCQSYSLPTMTNDQTEVTWAGFKRVYAGKQTRQGSWTVNFIEVWDAKIAEGFKTWLNILHNYKNGTISLLEDYKADVAISLVNPNVYDAKSRANGAEQYDIKLFDVFPTEVSLGEINASSSDPVEIKATFNYNYFLMGGEIDKSADNG